MEVAGRRIVPSPPRPRGRLDLRQLARARGRRPHHHPYGRYLGGPGRGSGGLPAVGSGVRRFAPKCTSGRGVATLRAPGKPRPTHVRPWGGLSPAPSALTTGFPTSQVSRHQPTSVIPRQPRLLYESGERCVRALIRRSHLVVIRAPDRRWSTLGRCAWHMYGFRSATRQILTKRDLPSNLRSGYDREMRNR